MVEVSSAYLKPRSAHGAPGQENGQHEQSHISRGNDAVQLVTLFPGLHCSARKEKGAGVEWHLRWPRHPAPFLFAFRRLTRMNIRSSLPRMETASAGPKFARGTPSTDQVLSAALSLFTERGYFNTSIPDIVKASSVSTGSIYHHFRDKEGIAKHLYASLVERMESHFDEIEAHHASVHDRCRASIGLLFNIAEDEPAIMRFMLFSRHKEFIPDQQPVCSSRPFVQMREMVTAGMNTGEVRQMTPVVAAAGMFGGALRLIQLRLDGVLDTPLPEYLDETWQCAWRSVAA